ncbi:TIGR01777 family oxidoreductase [Carboxylicivirga sp. N1Y90]|uniref:TIGR01777 family oxidoreductase n=1 Tax=Carboxylicivirga fragile TaxID=3417571 RepID=UPI003D35686D|nr:TIGR01777 family oxidoreductase [Marinilabiliaceae bacterium N1Y90]
MLNSKNSNKIAISGVTGFIGRKLKSFLQHNGFEVVSLTRRVLGYSPDKLANELEGCESIINLAGASIGKRWTDNYKKEILDSRIELTQKIVAAMRLMECKPGLFISASAVGIYDSFEVHDEFSTNYSNDFLSKVCQKWEREAYSAQSIEGVRLCIVRLGVVLGSEGGAFTELVKPFKLGLGAVLGDGHQVFPFIHIKDVLSGMWYLLKREASGGIYNFVAPQMISNKELCDAIAIKTKKSVKLKVSEWLLKKLVGEGAVMLLSGQKVIPDRMLKDDFHFAYPNIESVLDDLLK